MGFFGTYLYENGQWRDADPTTTPDRGDTPWLHVDIHDSDVTTLRYHPAGPGTGTAYLGITPRTYFENPDASAPTDVTREAAGLAAWWATIHEQPAHEQPAHEENGTDRTETAHDRRLAKEEEIIGYLAQDVDPEDDDLDDGDETDVDQLDDADIYVEIKTARLIAALGLPPAFTR